jgi:hypothetical protein
MSELTAVRRIHLVQSKVPNYNFSLHWVPCICRYIVKKGKATLITDPSESGVRSAGVLTGGDGRNDCRHEIHRIR